MARTSLVFLAVLVAAGCGGESGPPVADDARVDHDGAPAPDGGMRDAGPDAVIDAGPGIDAAPALPYADLDEGCAPIFSQSVLPDYHLTIAPDHWATMQHELMNPQFTASGNIVEPPYHQTQLRIVEGATVHEPGGVMIRLNGNTSWLQAIVHDDDPKMQFLIAFNKVDPDGRFQHMRKIKLDMPRSDWTFLQQRVALAWMRGRAGVPAQCANNARAFINGTYYGLFSNVEFQDKSFLKRVYGDADNDGDLWKAGRDIKTNEETFTWTRISAFWDAVTLGGMDAIIDLDTSMLEWASEAVIGDTDGYNQGRPNFLLYDRPSNQQFVWLANDLDTSLDEDFLPPDTTPVFAPTPAGQGRWERDWHHYLTALDDPAGVSRYVSAMTQQLPKLDPAELAAWIDDWSVQIAAAADTDPHRPFPIEVHDEALVRMKAYSPARVAYLGRWVDCWSSGGVDADGDGFDMCHDCQDDNPAQSPGAAEVCDQIDNDCDGRVDNVAGTCADPAASARQARWNRIFVDAKAEARARRQR